jgi:hypothetical protein
VIFSWLGEDDRTQDAGLKHQQEEEPWFVLLAQAPLYLFFFLLKELLMAEI